MARPDRILLGINAAYHESSAALLMGDSVAFMRWKRRATHPRQACQDFSTVSNPDELPWQAIRAAASMPRGWTALASAMPSAIRSCQIAAGRSHRN